MTAGGRQLQAAAQLAFATVALLAAAPDTSIGAELARQQSKVKGLLVQQLATGDHAGKASQMNATAIPADGGAGFEVSFNQDVGKMMEGALKEVVKFLRVRHDEWPAGYQVEIAFEDRYTAKDGPSAATACALLLDSLITGTAMDPAFAITGDMNADGSVRPVGGVAAKVRGASVKDCRLVAIPADNAVVLTDLVIAEGIAPVTRIQVFTAENFSQAKSLAAAEKDGDLGTAISEFALVQKAVRRGNLRHPKVVEKLNNIVRLSPNHLSAKLLLESATGRLPRNLSLAGSLDSVERAAATLIEAARSQRGGVKGVDKDELAAALDDLKRVRSKLDRRIWAYADAIHDFGESIRDYQNSPPRGVPMTRKKIEAIKREADRIESERRKIRNNKELMEELMQR